MPFGLDNIEIAGHHIPGYLLLLGAGLLLLLITAAVVWLVLRHRRSSRGNEKENRMAAIELSLSTADPAQLIANTGCSPENAEFYIRFASEHRQLATRLASLSRQAQALKYVDTAGYLTLLDTVMQRHGEALRCFMDDDQVTAVKYLNDVAADTDDREKRLADLRQDERALAELLGRIPVLRQPITDAQEKLAMVGGLDTATEQEQLMKLQTALERAEASLISGTVVQLPEVSAVDEVMESLEKKKSQDRQARDRLPAARQEAKVILEEISKALDTEAPVGGEKKKAEEMLALINEAGSRLEEGQPLVAAGLLERVDATLGDIRSALEIKAKMPEEFEQEIKARITLLLNSWKKVSPDMLVEVPADCRQWAIGRYYQQMRESEPLLLRGATLVTPEAPGAQQGPVPAAVADTAVMGPPFPAGGRGVCGDCGRPVDGDQQFCGHCGALVVT